MDGRQCPFEAHRIKQGLIKDCSVAFFICILDEFIKLGFQSVDEAISMLLKPSFQKWRNQVIQNLKWDLCFTMYLGKKESNGL